MFFLLLGEGGSDLGKSIDSPGPLLEPLKRIAGQISDESFDYDYVSKSELKDSAPVKNTSRRRNLLLRGNKRKFSGLVSVWRTAEALGAKAKSYGDGDCGAIYFSDCDYTNHEVNNPEMYYDDLVKAMEHGFYSASGYKLGVPMVPRTRSESWFLCHYQERPYENCDRFELLPANDEAPTSGKKLLGRFFGCAPTVEEIYQHITSEEVDWLNLIIPSFVFFKNRFVHVVERLMHIATTMPEPDTLKSDDLKEALRHGARSSTALGKGLELLGNR